MHTYAYMHVYKYFGQVFFFKFLEKKVSYAHKVAFI